jgi:hypothetical protein
LEARLHWAGAQLAEALSAVTNEGREMAIREAG